MGATSWLLAVVGGALAACSAGQAAEPEEGGVQQSGGSEAPNGDDDANMARVREMQATQCADRARKAPLIRVAPAKPEEARDVEGSVDVRFRIGADGLPTELQVTSAEPPGVFDAAAKEAVAKWVYCPPEPGARDYPDPMQVTLSFR